MGKKTGAVDYGWQVQAGDDWARPPDVHAAGIAFVGGWGSSSKPRPGAGVVIIAVRPGVSGEEAAAQLRRGGVRVAAGDVNSDGVAGFAAALKSYGGVSMQATAFGDANLLLPAFVGRLATHGLHVAPRHGEAGLRGRRQDPDLILVTGVVGDGSVTPADARGIIAILIG